MTGIIIKEQINKIDEFNEIHIKEEQHGDEMYRVTYHVTLSPERTIISCDVIGNEFIGMVTPPPTSPLTQEDTTITTPQSPEKEEDTTLSTEIPKFITEDTPTPHIEEQPLSPEEFAKEYHRANVIEDPQYIPPTEEVESTSTVQSPEEVETTSTVQTPEVITPTEKTSGNTTQTLEKQVLPQTGVNDVAGYALTGLGLSIMLLIFITKSKNLKK